MWLIALATIALVAGNLLRKSGVESARTNAYGSAAALAGRRRSGVGTWLNVAGSACLVAGICWAWI